MNKAREWTAKQWRDLLLPGLFDWTKATGFCADMWVLANDEAVLVITAVRSSPSESVAIGLKLEDLNRNAKDAFQAALRLIEQALQAEAAQNIALGS